MMIVRLFCPQCANKAIEGFKGFTTLDVRVPIVQIAESGLYEVVCEKGHQSMVALLNLKFELLFEIGLNAIIDGYHREAVTSFASALERFYEFYWRVVMHKFSVSEAEIVRAWKSIGRLSERQIGGYISASLLLTGHAPILLNANKEVPFRNNVVHNGYVPSADEAISFGDVIMNLINTELILLREHAPESLEAVYDSLLPRNHKEASESETELVGGANVLTAIDVKNPPSSERGDTRVGGVTDQFERILRDRQPHRMHIFQTQEEKEEYEKKADLERRVSASLTDNIPPGELLREIIESLRAQTGQSLTMEEVANGLCITSDTLFSIIEGSHDITPEIAIRLAASLSYTNPEFWLTIQSNYKLSQAEVDTTKVQVFWLPT